VTAESNAEPEGEPPGDSIGRRRFLLVSGAGAVAVGALGVLGLPLARAGAASTAAAKRPSVRNDLEVASLAASLEVLAVGTYKSALDAAAAGSLGVVPAAGAAYVKIAMSHHQAHLDKWNALLQAAGKPIVTLPNSRLKPTIDRAFARAKTFGRAAKVARDLEETTAATYLRAIPTLLSKDAINLAGSIHIIDMQHVAILNYVLGEYPVPDTFAKTGKAASA
jgi:hypothetical protein